MKPIDKMRNFDTALRLNARKKALAEELNNMIKRIATFDIPIWLMEKYVKLYEEFEINSFTAHQAKNVLNQKKGIRTTLSDLMKLGLLSSRRVSNDMRKVRYRLK